MKIQPVLLKKNLCIITGLLCLLAILFNLYYLLNTRQSLLSDYLNLNSCFYKSHTFAENFFNENTKKTGNVFSIISLIVNFLLLNILLKKYKRFKSEPKTVIHLQFERLQIPYYFAILLFSFAAWLYGVLLVPVSYDEVFSAMQAAGLPLFQTISYYMLPNNHIGFNALNSIFFFWMDDKVMSGKIISLLAFVCWNLAAYIALNKLMGSKPVALLGTLALALQFPVWGFAFEARGYELYGLCIFISFLSLAAYAKSSSNYWLLLNGFVSVLGYICLPTFMYMHLSQIFFGIWLALRSKTFPLAYFTWQFYIGAGTFLLYLPALCYSGIHAFTQNKYMHAMDVTYFDFILKTLQGLSSYLNYAISNNSVGKISIGILIAILPLLLLFSKKFRHKEFLILFILLCAATFALIVIMRRHPFHRNLAGHGYIMLFVAIYVVNFILNQLSQFLKNSKLIAYGMPVLLIAVITFSIVKNPQQFNFFLYFDDLNLNKANALQIIEKIPAGSTITCSDGCFFYPYWTSQKQIKNIKCGLNQASYYLIHSYETLPNDLLKKYELKQQVNDCLIYTLK
ncbi:MAG: hypothetical protein Q8M15_13790 [Bacteroidota bacterium]|nr:hypothetical protein [Bacteroidota bacterium]